MVEVVEDKGRVVVVLGVRKINGLCWIVVGTGGSSVEDSDPGFINKDILLPGLDVVVEGKLEFSGINEEFLSSNIRGEDVVIS